MKTFRSNGFQSGFTLIELMIALLIGAFLMTGVIQIFISAKQAYRLQENLSRLQENGRFAIDFIAKDVRMAGFIGCSKTLPGIVPPVPANSITEQTKINGVDSIANNWNSTAVCGVNSECIPATDTISFQYAKSCGGLLTTAMTVAAPFTSPIIITPSNSCSINAGNQLLIADCATSDVFSATSAGNSITHAALSKAYLTDAELFRFEPSVSYYIRKGAAGIPALWRVDSSGANELIEGIENMQIWYGVDSDPTPDYVANYYTDATTVNGAVVAAIPAVPAWTRVVSVRINLLAVTIENNLTDAPQPYYYNGATVPKTDLLASGTKAVAVLKTDTSQFCTYTGTLPSTCKLADDLRIHRVFSTTLAVRNRLP